MIRILPLLALVVTLALPEQALANCRVALALGLDISSSVNNAEYRLQMDGLANALQDKQVIEAILTPEGTHIAAAAYEWSGYQQQDVVLEWAILDTPGAIRAFAARLRGHQRIYSNFATALGKGVEFGAHMLHRSPPCARKVLDVSGDGENNIGVSPTYFRKQGLLDGITVNGLVIQGAQPDPAIYYRKHVIGGPEAFIVLARDFSDYRAAMIDKLLRELNAEMILGTR